MTRERSRPLRVGIVSANWGMAAHLPAWRAIEGVEVAAVCTSRRETAEGAAAKHGIAKAHWDAAAMAADPALDIVDVGTRPDLRREMVLAALAQGKHVLASANFAADLAAARAMRDAARRAGTIVALDSTLAQAPAHRQARTLIESGWVGTPTSVSARLGISLFAGAAEVGSHWRWFAKAAHGASALRNLGTHTLHLLVELLGPIASVSAEGMIAIREWRFPDGSAVVPEVEDTTHLLLRFERGAIGTVALGWSSPALLGWRMELSGTAGTIVTTAEGAWFPSGDGITLATGADARSLTEQVLPPQLRAHDGVRLPEDGIFPPQVVDIAGLCRDFVGAVRGEVMVSPDFERAYHIEAVLEAARRSIDARRRVTLDEVDPSDR